MSCSILKKCVIKVLFHLIRNDCFGIKSDTATPKSSQAFIVPFVKFHLYSVIDGKGGRGLSDGKRAFLTKFKYFLMIL